MHISRRNALKGLGAAALGLSIANLQSPARPGRAQSPTGQEVAAFYRFNIGEAQMTVMMDASIAFPPSFFGGNQPEDQMTEFFQSRNLLGENGVPVTVMILMMELGDTVALFDTGNGPQAGAKLLPTLTALGIAPEDVTDINMSHWHPDHINGLSTDGTLTFPNAAVHFPQPEFDFLQNGPQDVVADANAKLQPALDADLVSFYADGDEILPGVTPIHTPGHTPGHMAWRIENGGGSLIHFIDAVVNPYSAVSHPEWSFSFDADPAQATESRRMLLEMAASEGTRVMGYHFPFPGIGNIITDGDTQRFIPAAF
jgi:glyoxylase-like metal-dependent hydrolase (beta-lactamase superfamily II)